MYLKKRHLCTNFCVCFPLHIILFALILNLTPQINNVITFSIIWNIHFSVMCDVNDWLRIDIRYTNYYLTTAHVNFFVYLSYCLWSISIYVRINLNTHRHRAVYVFIWISHVYTYYCCHIIYSFKPVYLRNFIHFSQ